MISKADSIEIKFTLDSLEEVMEKTDEMSHFVDRYNNESSAGNFELDTHEYKSDEGYVLLIMIINVGDEEH
tara:strand:+ start:2238 stop:2450 length:213 start_codon:yes stop_codon:yes gene_type:complete